MIDNDNKMYAREYAKKLLADKFKELGRLPGKLDFSNEEIMAIKDAFGPWPRALEKAGLKLVPAAYILRRKLRQEKRRKRRLRSVLSDEC